MEEASWPRLLGQIRDGFVVPIVGCRLPVDAAKCRAHMRSLRRSVVRPDVAMAAAPAPGAAQWR